MSGHVYWVEQHGKVDGLENLNATAIEKRVDHFHRDQMSLNFMLIINKCIFPVALQKTHWVMNFADYFVKYACVYVVTYNQNIKLK